VISQRLAGDVSGASVDLDGTIGDAAHHLGVE